MKKWKRKLLDNLTPQYSREILLLAGRGVREEIYQKQISSWEVVLRKAREHLRQSGNSPELLQEVEEALGSWGHLWAGVGQRLGKEYLGAVPPP